jgi:nucleoside-diphosphate-sugar epimerase
VSSSAAGEREGKIGDQPIAPAGSPPLRIAVLGASGFIGRRIVERLCGDPRFAVRPVPRVQDAAFDAEQRIADARDENALAPSLAGCDVAVHAIAGDPRTIRDTIKPVVRAASRAGCRRIVYLGTAVVHGQAPVAEADESAPLPRDQRLAYNVAKRDAEANLLALGRAAGLAVVSLRPGIVYGPESRWITGVADALLAGRAGLVDGGRGLCNAIYVDNVVHAVALAATAPAVAGEAFLIGEGAGIPWREFYGRVAEPLGIPLASIPSISYDRRTELLRKVRGRLRGLARRAGVPSRDRSGIATPEERPFADREMALLHRARYVPAWTKARERLGYVPIVDPDDAWRQTIAWLAASGYPVLRR